MTLVGSFPQPPGTCKQHLPCSHGSRVDISSFIQDNTKKGGNTMTMQPGQAILTGQVDGRKVGQAIFQFMPSMPHESPVPLPRFLARALFPQGFIPGRLPVAQPPPLVQPPIQPPAPAAPPAPARNQVIRVVPPPPVPRKRVLERGTFPGWH